MQENLSELATITIDLAGISFSDPVLIDPLNGDVYEISIQNTEQGSKLKEVKLADYPLIVVERSTLNIQ